jgi:phosphoglycerate dehydrogenase-like enzyme
MSMGDEQLETKKVLITPQGMSLLTERFSELFGPTYEIEFTNGIITDKEKLKNLLRDKDAVILGSEEVDSNLLANCKKLAIISRFGAGYDAICIDSLKKYDVALAIVKGISSDVVARHTLSLFLSLTNNLIQQKHSVCAGHWDRTLNLSSDKMTVGLLGMGPIAQKFSEYLLVLGFQVQYFARSRKDFVENNGVKYISKLKTLIDSSDIISLHLKLVNETKNIIDKEMIRLMSGKYLINTARGGLVDEKALFHSLSNGGIKGAGLDVYCSEPTVGNARFLQSLPNVTATCHVSAYDRSSIEAVGKQTINNIRGFFENSVLFPYPE